MNKAQEKVNENLKNETYFYREDNPKLFDAILFEHYSNYFESFSPEILKNPKFKKDYLTKQELEDIYSLEIGKNIPEPLNLSGIEKLTNLHHLRVFTNSTDKAQSMLNNTYSIIKSNPTDKYIENMILKAEKNALTNQIEDFSPLYKCQNLEELDLSNQLNLTELHLEHFPLLRTLNVTNCANLQSVSGLESLEVFNKNKKNKNVYYAYASEFNFFECFNLKDIQNLDCFVDLLEENHIVKTDCRIILPTTTYCHLHNRYPDAVNRLSILGEQKTRDLFYWVESTSSTLKSLKLTTPKMCTLQMEISDICKEITAGGKDDSDLAKISGAYRWVVDHIHSDTFSVIKEDLRMFGTDLVAKTRNSVDTIKERKAVCVGVSNTLNLILAELGYVAIPCYCKENLELKNKKRKKTSNNESYLEKQIFANNHQISKMYLDFGSGKVCYYLDATWDLTRKKSKYFLVNKEELEKTHRLGIGEKDALNAKSIQMMLENKHYLVSRKKSQNFARLVNKSKGIANKYKGHAFVTYLLAKQLTLKSKNAVKTLFEKQEKERE